MRTMAAGGRAEADCDPTSWPISGPKGGPEKVQKLNPCASRPQRHVVAEAEREARVGAWSPEAEKAQLPANGLPA